jgi:hypothetical protein
LLLGALKAAIVKGLVEIVKGFQNSAAPGARTTRRAAAADAAAELVIIQKTLTARLKVDRERGS